MPIQNCWGDHAKREILDRYWIEPGPRCIILHHQADENIRVECCKRPLKHEFWQFFYRPKPGGHFSLEFPNETGSFFVGHGCGRTFIDLLNDRYPEAGFHEPPLFNPLRHLGQLPPPPPVDDDDDQDGDGGEDGRHPGGRRRRARLPLTPLNSEVVAVLQLLATICRTPISADLNAMLTWLREHPAQDTHDRYLSRLNNAVRDHRELQGRTLRQAMEDEEHEGAEAWREFTFHNIERILRDNDVESHIDPNADIPLDPPVRREAVAVRTTRQGFVILQVQPGDERAILFPDCRGFAEIDGAGLGDKIRVRIAAHPDGPRAVRVYEKIQTAVRGTIGKAYGTYAFLVQEEGGADILIPGFVYDDIDRAPTGTRVAVHAIDTDRGPRATWAMRLP